MVATGLVRFAAVSASGLTELQLALRAGDGLATQLLDDAANNFALFMSTR
jgi:type IV secretion system protein TrbL